LKKLPHCQHISSALQQPRLRTLKGFCPNLPIQWCTTTTWSQQQQLQQQWQALHFWRLLTRVKNVSSTFFIFIFSNWYILLIDEHWRCNQTMPEQSVESHLALKSCKCIMSYNYVIMSKVWMYFIILQFNHKLYQNNLLIYFAFKMQFFAQSLSYLWSAFFVDQSLIDRVSLSPSSIHTHSLSLPLFLPLFLPLSLSPSYTHSISLPLFVPLSFPLLHTLSLDLGKNYKLSSWCFVFYLFINNGCVKLRQIHFTTW